MHAWVDLASHHILLHGLYVLHLLMLELGGVYCRVLCHILLRIIVISYSLVSVEHLIWILSNWLADLLLKIIGIDLITHYYNNYNNKLYLFI